MDVKNFQRIKAGYEPCTSLMCNGARCKLGKTKTMRRLNCFRYTYSQSTELSIIHNSRYAATGSGVWVLGMLGKKDRWQHSAVVVVGVKPSSVQYRINMLGLCTGGAWVLRAISLVHTLYLGLMYVGLTTTFLTTKKHFSPISFYTLLCTNCVFSQKIQQMLHLHVTAFRLLALYAWILTCTFFLLLFPPSFLQKLISPLERNMFVFSCQTHSY